VPDWQSTCYTTNGKYVFHIVLHNLKVANAYLEPQYVGADKGNIACLGHRLCDCNTIWAETM